MSVSGFGDRVGVGGRKAGVDGPKHSLHIDFVPATIDQMPMR